MKACAIMVALSGALASPALAQDAMDHMNHAGHAGHGAPAPAPAPAPTPPPPPAEDETPDPVHYGHRMAGPDTPVAITTVSEMELRARYRDGSGTARLPGNEPAMAGLHVMSGDWMLMLHGNAALQYTRHTGPRGDDKTYVTSMAMAAADRQTGWGRIRFSAMASLEPAMDARGYPNLFATGETAGGLPLIDRQHPHDLFMELSGRVDVNAGAGSLFVYGGPVGEPALGPSAFMHRAAASNNPEPPITHHWFDSTHITYGVVTVGYSAPGWQLEASAFRGREPDERRWNIETPKLDSWAVRATFTPTPAWAFQASYGALTSPEALHPAEDERRFTASAAYAGPGGFSAMAAFSRKGHDGDNHNAWLAEANWNIDPRNSVFSRFENVDNGELFPDPLDPRHDAHFAVSKLQAGYARHIPLGAFSLSLGGSANLYAKPDALDSAYGDSPWGYTLFVKFALGR